MSRFPILTRCQLKIEAEQRDTGIVILEECPAGQPVGLDMFELLDRCLGCPKAEPQPTDIEIRFSKKKPVPKKVIKWPVLKKTQ
jgi:hypothetical protein